MQTLMMLLLLFMAIFLILVILIQKGKGGGLAGAFGGIGGQSAFGTRAGDLFTRITIGIAAVWIALCLLSVKYLGGRHEKLRLQTPPGTAGQSAEQTSAVPATTEQPNEQSDASGASQASSGDSAEQSQSEESQ